MKLTPECVPCLLKRVAYEVELNDPEKTLEALRLSAEVVSRRGTDDISSAEFASDIHARAYDLLGGDDPYAELKRRSTEVALGLLPEAEAFIRGSEERLRAAMIVSIIGNTMDFGIQGSLENPESLREQFVSMLHEPLGLDDSLEIGELMKGTDELFFLADNCGEIVFDGLLLQEIKSLGPRMVVVVKGKPVLTDVTLKDLQGLGIEDTVDEIVETKGFAVGIDLWSGANRALIGRMRESDLIVSKGMANFEAMSESDWKAIAYIMRVKCDPVARAVGAARDKNIIKLVRSMTR